MVCLNQSINQPTNQPINQSINQSIDQPRPTFFALVPTKCTIALRGVLAVASDHLAQSFRPNRSLNPPSIINNVNERLVLTRGQLEVIGRW